MYLSNSLALYLGLALCATCSQPSRVRAQHVKSDKVEAMFKWVVDKGGEVNIEAGYNRDGARGVFATKDIAYGDDITGIPPSLIFSQGVNVETGYNGDGIRGIFATKDIAYGEDITRIPPSLVFNQGNSTEFSYPLLLYIKEWKSGYSRFQPYLDANPQVGEVVNACNFPSSYIGMLHSEALEVLVLSYYTALEDLLSGAFDAELSLVISDVVDGNVTMDELQYACAVGNVTMDNLQYACAVTSSRYVIGTPRPITIMAPVFDLANHMNNCLHYIAYHDDGSPSFRLVAGKDIKKGEEICYDYGALTDDHALISYGFLQKREDPPSMSAVDLPDYDEESVEIPSRLRCE
eukprot:gene4390-14516_t